MVGIVVGVDGAAVGTGAALRAELHAAPTAHAASTAAQRRTRPVTRGAPRRF
jgi:hypothetical protein